MSRRLGVIVVRGVQLVHVRVEREPDISILQATTVSIAVNLGLVATPTQTRRRHTEEKATTRRAGDHKHR